MLITETMEMTDETMRNLATNTGISLARVFSAGAAFTDLYWQVKAAKTVNRKKGEKKAHHAYVKAVAGAVRQMAKEIWYYSLSCCQKNEKERRFVHCALHAALAMEEVKDNVRFLHEIEEKKYA